MASKKVWCPLCGIPKRATPNASYDCMICQARLVTDEDGDLVEAVVQPEKLAEKFMCLRPGDVDRLFEKMCNNALDDEDTENYERIQEAKRIYDDHNLE